MDLWTMAGADVEAEHAAGRLVRAKVAVAPLWPFLSMARSEHEFEHRLALTAARLDECADGDPALRDAVTASLREDFAVVAAKDNDDDGDDTEDADDSNGKPDWLQKKIDKKESSLQYFDAGLGRWVAVQSGQDADQYEPERGRSTDSEGEDDDPDEEASWRDLGSREGAREPQGAARWPEWGPDTKWGDHDERHLQDLEQRHEDAWHNNTPLSRAYGDNSWEFKDRLRMMREKKRQTSGGAREAARLEFFHAGLGRWVAVEDDATAGKGNPYYFTGGPEGGPNTGQTNQYPASPTNDPVDPLNQMFPMQPTPWQGGVEWQEQPMNFNPPRSASRGRHPFLAADLAGQNPHYFDGGEEGVQGEDAFPTDLAAGVDPTDERVDWYQNPMQPLAGRRRANGAPDSDPLLGTEFDSPQERERWAKAQRGEDPGSRDSTAMTGARHTLYDPYDPSIRSVALSGGGTDPAPIPGQPSKPVPNQGPVQPGTELAQNPANASTTFADAMGKSTQDAGRGTRTSRRRTALGDTGTGVGEQAVGGVPDVPPSMTPDGPGSIAQRPLTTSPRQIPSGGGGMPTDMGGEDPSQQATAAWHQGLGVSRDLPDDTDPTGVGDEYRERTIDGPLSTRPRQPLEHRNPNTPQTPKEPIPSNSSANAEAEEDEEERRTASRIANRALRELVGA